MCYSFYPPTSTEETAAQAPVSASAPAGSRDDGPDGQPELGSSQPWHEPSSPPRSPSAPVPVPTMEGYRAIRYLQNGKPNVKVVLAEPLSSSSPRPGGLPHKQRHTNTNSQLLSTPPSTPPSNPPLPSNEHQGQPHAHGSGCVVVKAIQWRDETERRCAMTELHMLRLASQPSPSPYVVPLLGAMGDARHVVMVLPYIHGGDLCDIVNDSDGGLPEDEARLYFRHMLEGLLHLKQRNIAHGDVSLENVVLSGSGCGWSCPYSTDSPRPSPSCGGSCGGCDGPPRAMLVDLGSATSPGPHGRVPASQYRYRGKLGCVPPEVAFGDPAHDVDPFVVDVWGLGTCLYTLLTGRSLYSNAGDPAFGHLVSGKADLLLAHYATFGLRIPPDARHLICAMLNPNPSARPTLEEIAQHRWMSGLTDMDMTQSPPLSPVLSPSNSDIGDNADPVGPASR